MNKNRNTYIKPSHIKAVERFNNEIKAFAESCEEPEATLWEDAFTSFTLSNIRVEDGYLCFLYDSEEEKVNMVREYDGEVWEEDGMDSIMGYIKFWRACLRRARRFWSMDVEKLDQIQSGEREDENDEDNY